MKNERPFSIEHIYLSQIQLITLYIHVYSKTIESAIFAPPNIIEQGRTCKFYLFQHPYFKLKNNCLNMFKNCPTEMVNINMKIPRNRPTRDYYTLHFYLIFRIFHPTTLIRWKAAIRYCRVTKLSILLFARIKLKTNLCTE